MKGVKLSEDHATLVIWSMRKGSKTSSSQPDVTSLMVSLIIKRVEEITTEERNARKVREGLVVSNKMNQTAVIAIVERVRHKKYDKFVLRTKKLYAHDAANDVNIGDRVRVMEIRPMSKLKRWRIIEILERAK